MNYILDYFSNLTDNKHPNLVFSSFQNVQLQDPLSKLIKWLNTDRGVGIKIKRFHIDYGRSIYSLAGATNHLSISTNFSEFIGKEKKEAESILE